MTTDPSHALERLLRGRYSCRAFLPQAVPRESLERVLDLAQLTPSWCNTQPWHVVFVEGDDVRTLATALTDQAETNEPNPDLPFPSSYEAEFRDRRRAAGWALYDAVGVARGDREASASQSLRNYVFFDAPAVAIITAPRSLGVYGAIDCGLFVQSFMLAAQSLGLATIAQASIAAFAPFVREHLGIPDARMVVCAVAIGFPEIDHPANSFRTSRIHPIDAVAWYADRDKLHES